MICVTIIQIIATTTTQQQATDNKQQRAAQIVHIYSPKEKALMKTVDTLTSIIHLKLELAAAAAAAGVETM